jgi:hypothetical protein
MNGGGMFLGAKNIYSSTIDLPESEICVWMTIFELFLIHADLELLEGGRVAQAALLGRIGRSKKLFRDLGLPLSLRLPEDLTPGTIQERDRIFNEIENDKNYFLDSGIFEISVTVDPDVFMELILTCVRSEILNFQSYIKKETLKAKTEIAARLLNLKTNYNENYLAIFNLEKQLVCINDSEIR